MFLPQSAYTGGTGAICNDVYDLQATRSHIDLF